MQQKRSSLSENSDRDDLLYFVIVFHILSDLALGCQMLLDLLEALVADIMLHLAGICPCNLR